MLDWEKWDTVGGWFNRAEGQFLYDTVMQLPARSRILEIGCYHGRSTIVMLQACKDSGLGNAVVSVDPFVGTGDKIGNSTAKEKEDGTKIVYNNISKFNLSSFYGGCWTETSEQFFSRKNKSIYQYQMIFIDGCHKLVADDMRAAWQILWPTGVLVCHDYDVNDKNSQTVKDIDSVGLPGKHCGVWGTSLWIARKP